MNIQNCVLFFLIFAAAGIFWYGIFYHREKRLLDRLQSRIDSAANDKQFVSAPHVFTPLEISESKLSLLENSLRRFLDESTLAQETSQQQKNIIQELISDIAHQTLTPISNLRLYSDLLAENYEDHSLEISAVQEQTEKLDFLIQSLVKLSRMESGIITAQPKELPVSMLLRDVTQEYAPKAAEKHISLNLCELTQPSINHSDKPTSPSANQCVESVKPPANNSEASLTARFDLKWTREAIGNILDNAIKYTPYGGAVTIAAKPYTFFVRIDIKDNGIGIPETDLHRIFARFYRGLDVADQPGVGIGLYLAREIIQAQKGYIKVSSRPGQGSVFSVFLPI